MKRGTRLALSFGLVAVCAAAGTNFITHRIQEKKTKYNYFSAELIKKRQITSDISVFDFTLDGGSNVSDNLPLPQPKSFSLFHVFAVDGGTVFRPYTPLFVDPSSNLFSLMIKNYGSDGFFSNFLFSLRLNSFLNFFGTEKILDFKLNHEEDEVTIQHLKKSQVWNLKTSKTSPRPKMVFISTGSGLAPMVQIISNISKFPIDLKLIHFAKTQDDLTQIKDLTTTPSNLEEVYIVPSIYQHHNCVHAGAIDAQSLENFLDPKIDRAIIVCGSDRFLSKLCGTGHEDGNYINQPKLRGILAELGFEDHQVFRL